MLNTYTRSIKGFENKYGRRVRRFRVYDLDNSQEEFAKKLGISAGYLSQIELGRVTPSAEVRNKIDEYMNKYNR